MIHSVNNTQQIQLTTITPVSIGDGGTLSPLTDYIVEGGKVYYINHKKFQNTLAKNDRLMNQFIQGVKYHTTEAKDDFLKDFITDQLNIKNWKSLTTDPDSKVRNKLYGNPTEFKTILKDGTTPYLSGSTLKGAIRTALLYDWHIDKKKNSIAEEQDLFGEVKEGHKSRFFKLSDTNISRDTNSDNSIVVIGTERIRIKTAEKEGDSTPPSPREAIKENTQLQFKIKIEKDFYLDLNSLLAKTDAFYKACAKFELQELRKANHPSFKEEIKNLVLFYEKTLWNNIKEGEILMRIGLGKTRYDNSLMLAIYHNDNDTYKNSFREHRKKHWNVPENQNIYPASRTITKHDHLPLGWVKLKLLNP